MRDQAYYQAEKKIEAARRSGAIVLSFSHFRLTELPVSISHLTQLNYLNLSSNQLKTLPDSIGQLTQLKSLNLSSNMLRLSGSSHGIPQIWGVE